MNRFFALTAAVGTVGYAALSALHGNPPIDSPQAILSHVADKPWWFAAHMANILAVVLWLIALTGFTSGLPGRARSLGRAATAVMASTTAVFAIYFSLHGFAFSTLAQRLGHGEDRAIFAQTDAVLTVLGSVAFTGQAMLGLSVALFGATALLGGHSRWLGLGGIIAGGGWLIGALLINFAIIVPFTALGWLWMLGVAVVLWRRPDDVAQK